MQKLALRFLPLALLLFASAATAQRSELTLQVVDVNGAELGPVQLTFTSPEGEVLEAATRKNGKLKIRLKAADEPWTMLMADGGAPGPGDAGPDVRGPGHLVHGSDVG